MRGVDALQLPTTAKADVCSFAQVCLLTASPLLPPQKRTTEQLPNGDVVSGSGDCTIRVWRDGACAATIRAHGDSVRGLALLGDVGVVSASHDQTLKVGGPCFPAGNGCWWLLFLMARKGRRKRAAGELLARWAASLDLRGVRSDALARRTSRRPRSALPRPAPPEQVWTFSGEPIAELVGHTALVYCAATAAGEGLIASGSEDNTVRLWHADGTCLQVRGGTEDGRVR